MRLVPLVVLLLLALAAPATAYHPDPDAPPGAPAVWLPDEPWVDHRWLPFEQRTLLEQLGVDYEAFHDVLVREQPLADFARERGLEPAVLVARLLAWRRNGATPLTEMRRRTWKVLTQPHLAAHVFTHHFHDSALVRAAPSIFGITPQRYDQLMTSEMLCPLDLARRYGRSRVAVQTRTLAALRAAQRAGVRRGAMPAAQEETFAFSARVAFTHWLTSNVHGRPLPKRARSGAGTAAR